MKRNIRLTALLLSLTLCFSLLTGCAGSTAQPQAPSIIELATTAAPAEEAEEAAEVIDETAEETAEAAISTESPGSLTEEAPTEPVVTEAATESTLTLDPNGSYNSADDVALYIHLYGELPGNFITKKAAQKLGWSGGSLEEYAPGKSIGGSYFGNNEGILPDGDYHECDIDTLGKKKRGAKRIVYSADGSIYYTEDHYETFTLLYTAEGPVTEEIVYGAN